MGYIIGVQFNKEKTKIVKVKYEYINQHDKTIVEEKTIEEMAQYIIDKKAGRNGVKTKNKDVVGQTVEVVLRTVADNKESNNLENLPTF